MGYFDILSVPEFEHIEVAFTDINSHNLSMVTELCQRDIHENGLDIKIQASTDRRVALKDAKCVGDTLCAGGIMYGQRGISEMLNICKDIREVAAEDVLLLNYANPMAMLTWACNKYGGVQTVGLCHGVQGGHSQIAEVFGLDKKEVDIICEQLCVT